MELREDETAKKREEERPRYREFTVTPGVCGFKVKIGCSEAYFKTALELADAIHLYLADPRGAERRFMSQDIRMGGGIAIPLGMMSPSVTAPGYLENCDSPRRG
jgi:hypothetical protein